MIKQIFLIALLISIFSCTNNTRKSTSNTLEKIKDTIPVTWIEVADSLSNFEALLATDHLYYLEHMSPEYLTVKTKPWEFLDTLQNNDWTYTRRRGAACKTVKNIKFSNPFCVENQEHIINKSLGKVIQFSGTGSGYFAKINFVYDDSGRLLEYKDFYGDKIFYLKYDATGQLSEILKTIVTHGIKRKEERFKFKKSSSDDSRTEL